ncbi:radical SAM protein [Anaerocolumna chitinilytica]|uniref:Radical SAM core domain-containing protein n=1 Tax=Anaerocolumna chitinilytica TaxID=1727145 RepID=A0A7M3SA67_9FIRM|nr:radical SAM protein [Anaerocolumna chitinilytica]BCK01485.1 hypothetical protein bsdcttw_45250 [Anaerocolumna chitinilytica]
MDKLAQSPVLAYIRILESCNAGCMMCKFARSKNKNVVTFDNFKKIVNDLVQIGVKEIRLTGGEPTIHKDIIPMIKYIKSLGLKTSLITNGLTLPLLAKQYEEAGLDKIICSLDSPYVEIHNELRGKDKMFENATLGLNLINQYNNASIYKIDISINTVISNKTFKSLLDFIPLLKKLGVNSWSLIQIKDNKDLELSAKEIIEYEGIANTLQKRLAETKIKLRTNCTNIFCKKINYDFDNICFYPLCVIYIDAINNTAIPCNCLIHRQNDLLLSKIIEKGIDKIWNEPKYVEKRIAFTKVATKTCIGCDPSNLFSNQNIINKLKITNNEDLREMILNEIR